MFITDKKIVIIGGGTGTAALVKHLKHLCSNLTAVVAVTDGGGSSEVFRRLFEIFAIGDARQVISALSEDDEIASIMEYRFGKPGGWLHKHPIGNIVLAGVIEWCKIHYRKDYLHHAFRIYMKLCRANGAVRPATLDNVHLVAHMSDGETILGEGAIDTRLEKKDKKEKKKERCRRIAEVSLDPPATLNPVVEKDLLTAHLIVFASGSPFTSIYPNLCVRGFVEAISRSSAKLVQVMNLMTNENETSGWMASDHTRGLVRLLGRPLDYVICNQGPVSPDLHMAYMGEESDVVDVDEEGLSGWVRDPEEGIILGDFIEETHGVVRHNAALAEVIAHL